MNMEKLIMDLTSKTPSGGTCWVGDTPFTVWYCSDLWEWEFQGVFYFDPQDLGEAIEAYLQQTVESTPLAVSLSKHTKPWPKLAERKRISFPSRRSDSGLVSGSQR
jgi:hypothetical protein